jgi:hypothetical protein
MHFIQSERRRGFDKASVIAGTVFFCNGSERLLLPGLRTPDVVQMGRKRWQFDSPAERGDWQDSLQIFGMASSIVEFMTCLHRSCYSENCAHSEGKANASWIAILINLSHPPH